MKKLLSLFLMVGFVALLIGCHAGGNAPFINVKDPGKPYESASVNANGKMDHNIVFNHSDGGQTIITCDNGTFEEGVEVRVTETNTTLNELGSNQNVYIYTVEAYKGNTPVQTLEKPLKITLPTNHLGTGICYVGVKYPGSSNWSYRMVEDGTISLNSRLSRASVNTPVECNFYRMGIQIALFLFNEANVTEEQKSNLVSVNKVTTTSSKDDENGILTLSINMEGENLGKLDANNISVKVTFKSTDKKEIEIETNGHSQKITPVRDDKASDGKTYYIELPKLSSLETDGLTKAVLTYSFNLKDLTAENFPEGFLIELKGEVPNSLIENFSYSEFYNYGSESGDDPSGDDPSGDDPSGDEPEEESTIKIDGNTMTIDLGGGIKVRLIKPEGKSYYLAETEVTQEQYFKIMGTNPSEFKEGSAENVAPTTSANYPVESVKWTDIMGNENTFMGKLNAQFADKLAQNSLSGYKFTLPSDEQWEECYYTGSQSDYGLGQNNEVITRDEDDVVGNIGEYAVYSENSNGKTAPVLSKKSNKWGFYGMLGNVTEWTTGTLPGGYKYRGGSYKTGTFSMKVSSQSSCSAAESDTFNSSYGNFGFRIALVGDGSSEGEESGEGEGEPQGEGESEATLEPSNDGKSLTINLGNDIKINLIKPEGADYYLGETEVTQAQYFKIMGTNPSEFKDGSAEDVAPTTTADYPVDKVSWLTIMGVSKPDDPSYHDYENNFMKKLNEQLADKLAENNLSGYKFTLPSVDQWEFCFYAGSENDLGIGENSEEITDSNFGDYAVYGESTDKVKSKKPNAWGFYDMHGNVSEWTSSKLQTGYKYRGGSYKTSSASSMKPKNQSSWSELAVYDKDSYRGNFGFRIALVKEE